MMSFYMRIIILKTVHRLSHSLNNVLSNFCIDSNSENQLLKNNNTDVEFVFFPDTVVDHKRHCVNSSPTNVIYFNLYFLFCCSTTTLPYILDKSKYLYKFYVYI